MRAAKPHNDGEGPFPRCCAWCFETADAEDAPCETCGVTVHFQHDPPQECGRVLCWAHGPCECEECS